MSPDDCLHNSGQRVVGDRDPSEEIWRCDQCGILYHRRFTGVQTYTFEPMSSSPGAEQ